MSGTLKDRINEDVKTALKAGEKERLGCLRFILAALKQREVDERITLDDPAILDILSKLVKQRRESIAQFEKAGRADLVEKENFELSVIQAYFPTPLSDAEIDALIESTIAETGASSIKEMGKIMGILKGKLENRADVAEVSKRVKARLGG